MGVDHLEPTGNLLNGPWWREAALGHRGAVLLDADIVVNPTHDLMGNAGTLIAKRKWLSQPVNDRNRVYISASNWNSRGPKGRKQSPNSETLHTVYLSGEKQTLTPLPGQGYMYRECGVTL